MAWFGSKRTTLDAVGQYFLPCRFMFTVMVPVRSALNGHIPLHCGLHSGIRFKSDKTVHARSGAASTSIDVSRFFFVTATPGGLTKLSCEPTYGMYVSNIHPVCMKGNDG